MNKYKKAAIIFAILFSLAYLVGAMFTSFNTREWPDTYRKAFITYFVFITAGSLAYVSNKED